MPQRRLILASASPRRQEALRALDLPHEIVVSHAEETLPPQPDPTDPLPAARAKAQDVLARNPDALVLAGDTIVATGKTALGKPGIPERAMEMLRILRGTRHAVHTSVVLSSSEGETESTVIAPLAMRDYSDDEIERYVATGEPLDCAGAYDIHREGGALIASYEGCFSAIVGLPIVEIARQLTSAGVRVPQGPEEVCSALYGRRCLALDPLTRPRCLPQGGGVLT